MLEIDSFTQAPDTYIYEVVRSHKLKYRTRRVRADSSHPYCNNNLSTNPRYRMDVYEVLFQTEKERGVGAINAKIDKELIRIPEAATQMIKRARTWRRKNGKIIKKDDHEWDAAVCFFSKYAPKVPLQHVSRSRPIAIKPRGR